MNALLNTVWDDINFEAEAILVSPITYEPEMLSNNLYAIIDDPSVKETRRKKKLVRDLPAIRAHRDTIMIDENLTMLMPALFRSEEIATITALDRVFLNSYYRRLLRAHLERKYTERDLIPGLIITNSENAFIDQALVAMLRLLRVICKFLGITSTTHAEQFSREKLYAPIFWASASEKCLELLGENRVSVIEATEPPVAKNVVETAILLEQHRQWHSSKAFILLNIIFNAWSGSILTIKGTYVKIVPPTYVTRMLNKLK